MTLSRSRSTGTITTSVKLSRWVSAGVCFMSVRSMTSQPKPASWSSSGFSTWLRSSRRSCLAVVESVPMAACALLTFHRMRSEVAWQIVEPFVTPERQRGLAGALSRRPVVAPQLLSRLPDDLEKHRSIMWLTAIWYQNRRHARIAIGQLAYLLVIIDPEIGEITATGSSSAVRITQLIRPNVCRIVSSTGIGPGTSPVSGFFQVV